MAGKSDLFNTFSSFMVIFDISMKALTWLGRLGPKAVAPLVVIGILCPWLGRLLTPFVSEAVFLLLCTSFLRVNMTSARAYLQRPYLVLAAVGWTAIVIPLLIGAIGLLLGLDEKAPHLFLALILQAVASPIMSAPAFALLLGLDGTLVLVIMFFSTALLPISAPLIAKIFVATALTIPPMEIAIKLAGMSFGAAAVGFILRHAAGRQAIARHNDKINGFNILVLFVFAAAIMKDVGIRILNAPILTLSYTICAFTVFFALFFLSFLVFQPAGKKRALALGLMVSQRNMGLMLAATGGALPELTWLYIALAQFPIYFSVRLFQPFVKNSRN